MLRALLQASLNLISSRPCPLCGREADPRAEAGPCLACRQRFALPEAGLAGEQPLAWQALGAYDGPYRLLLLSQRRNPKGAVLRGLARALAPLVPGGLEGTILVSVPSWKRQGNPLPGLVAQQLSRPTLGAQTLPLLQRSRPTLGQHHLNRQLRLSNQQGAFRLDPAQRAGLGAPETPAHLAGG
jgi:predicted amidophosphoribosyltransferase